MLKDSFSTRWLTCSEGLNIELAQGADEGKDVSGYVEKIETVLKIPDLVKREKRAEEIMDELSLLPVKEDYQYVEPSDLYEIKAERPCPDAQMRQGTPIIDENILLDKIYGAWLGRCAGCLLGQPVEGWKKERITGLLKETGNYPISYYISSDISDDLRKKYGVSDEGKVYGGNKINWINNIKYSPEDDDTNYTVLSLKILEEYGKDFTPDDVAEGWLMNLPIGHVCTAERIAYKNLSHLFSPPGSAKYRNPYREWIGAQIRGDFYGYITPGNPELAAEMAWRDASISHVKNGIYGEMMMAAMISAAAETDDIGKIIRFGMSQIPHRSRLAEGIETVLGWKKAGVTWEDAINKLHDKYDENNPHEWTHTIPNAVAVCLGLLYGGQDFEKTIGIAVLSAFDTDCNGATAGSIIGMMLGAKALPQKWIAPLNDTLKSGVDGFGVVKISDLAERTMSVLMGIKRRY